MTECITHAVYIEATKSDNQSKLLCQNLRNRYRGPNLWIEHFEC